MADAGFANESPICPNGDSLVAFANQNIDNHWYGWAIGNYKPVVKILCSAFARRNLLEIGGGRSPLLTEQEARDFGISYTVNDISAMELDRCPAWAQRVCFDVAGAVPEANYG